MPYLENGFNSRPESIEFVPVLQDLLLHGGLFVRELVIESSLPPPLFQLPVQARQPLLVGVIKRYLLKRAMQHPVKQWTTKHCSTELFEIINQWKNNSQV